METRKNPRLREYDYSANGAYFVTVCSENKRHIFGSVVGAGQCPAPTVSLPKILSALKSLSTREAGRAVWQRGYYEHVCRDYNDYIACCQYVLDNPAKWAEDEYYI